HITIPIEYHKRCKYMADMTESKAGDAPISKEINSQMMAAAAIMSSPFVPCVWGDFFLTYTPPVSQRSEEWMRERADQLKSVVLQRFDAGKAMNMANTVKLVDALERLNLDNHFQPEIDTALRRVYSDEDLDVGGSKELYITALRFRLLRQHGFWVSTDVFDRFRDGAGSFSIGLSSDPRGLLSLYNAAHMAVPGEDVLDIAIAFTRSHLKAMKGKLRSPMAEQVSRFLSFPLPRFIFSLETTHYIAEYEQEEEHDAEVLELARLECNLMRSVHLKELSAFSSWWRNLYDDVKLNYARDRAVEMYFWAAGTLHGEGNSRARMMVAKMIALTILLDDTYDVHATLDDCQKLDKAMQRWDEGAVSILPEYLRMLYTKTLSTFSEFEDMLLPDEKYRMSYIRKAVEVSVMSSAVPMLTVASLIGAGTVATRETFDWAISVPNMVHSSAEIGRFLNDIASYKRGKNKMDVASTVECYILEHGTTGEEAVAAITAMTEHAWRRINQTCMEMDRAFLPAAQLAVVSLARTMELIYYSANDAYTFSGDLKDLVASLFLKPIPT
ncbi:hypothetical protein EJB05_06532, partial [Eragrostis curvula]